MQILADQERVLGADHPDTLTTRGNLAVADRAGGPHGGGAPVAEQTLTDRARVVGADHPDTLTTRSDIAALTGATGRTDEALRLL